MPDDFDRAIDETTPEQWDALLAKCGFSWDDADACTDRANDIDIEAAEMLVPPSQKSEADTAKYRRLCDERDAWDRLAAKIAALLPPSPPRASP